MNRLKGQPIKSTNNCNRLRVQPIVFVKKGDSNGPGNNKL